MIFRSDWLAPYTTFELRFSSSNINLKSRQVLSCAIHWLISRVRDPYDKLWTEFFPSFYGPSAKRAGHENKEVKKRRSITCRTNRANEANKIFIIWLCWLFRFWKGDRELEVRTATYGPWIDQSQHAKSFSYIINSRELKRNSKVVYSKLEWLIPSSYFIGYPVRVGATSAFGTTGLLIVLLAVGEWKLVGVCFISTSACLGAMTFFAMTVFYQHSTVSAYCAGTGSAILLANLYYLGKWQSENFEL